MLSLLGLSGPQVLGHDGGMVVAVVLAAGEGSRFDGPEPKLRTEFNGRPLVAHAVDAAAMSGLHTIVVTGAVDISDLLPSTVQEVDNPGWAGGQATSVQVAIATARDLGYDAIVVGLGDQPFVTSDAWKAVGEDDSPIAVATYAGRRGHPVRLGADVWEELPVAGDAVGRVVMENRPELVREIPCGGAAVDIDTREDLRKWS